MSVREKERETVGERYIETERERERCREREGRERENSGKTVALRTYEKIWPH